MADVVYRHRSGRWRVVFVRTREYLFRGIHPAPPWAYIVQRRMGLFGWRTFDSSALWGRREAEARCRELAERAR